MPAGGAAASARAAASAAFTLPMPLVMIAIVLMVGHNPQGGHPLLEGSAQIVAGVVAGAMSMAVGEYVSVSAQRDTERALLQKEKKELLETPEAELQELTEIYENKGLSPETARRVAPESLKLSIRIR